MVCPAYLPGGVFWASVEEKRKKNLEHDVVRWEKTGPGDDRVCDWKPRTFVNFIVFTSPL